MTMQVILIIGCVVCGIIAFVIGFMWRTIADRKHKDRIIEETHEEAERIVREAQKEAELSKKTALLEAKDEWFKAKAEFEREAGNRRGRRRP